MVNMRPFNTFERKNLEFLVSHNVVFTQVEVTATGLKKSILDSTAPMRTYFLENGIHNYENQHQGPEFKAVRRAAIFTDTQKIETKAAFYRPKTKKGDPRMWIYGLGAHSGGGEIHALFKFEDSLCSVNITRVDIEKCYNSAVITPLQDVLREIDIKGNIVSDELLTLFRSVRDQWFESEVVADTGIGRSIESFLGIRMNSDKTPDYKGIELKSHREKRNCNKNVLFTQTPDWDISTLKSGRQIVEAYGYYTNDGKKTYQNTVQCSIPNRQSLLLNLNQEGGKLELAAQKDRRYDVAAWRLVKLHQRLQTKHHETFWIEVENDKRNGKEFFRYKRIEHTKNPNVNQFDALIGRNLITVDLLLCRPSGHGDTYSFKIKKGGMPLLFPESAVYDL